jgi:hypothetical protein
MQFSAQRYYKKMECTRKAAEKCICACTKMVFMGDFLGVRSA